MLGCKSQSTLRLLILVRPVDCFRVDFWDVQVYLGVLPCFAPPCIDWSGPQRASPFSGSSVLHALSAR